MATLSAPRLAGTHSTGAAVQWSASDCMNLCTLASSRTDSSGMGVRPLLVLPGNLTLTRARPKRIGCAANNTFCVHQAQDPMKPMRMGADPACTYNKSIHGAHGEGRPQAATTIAVVHVSLFVYTNQLPQPLPRRQLCSRMPSYEQRLWTGKSRGFEHHLKFPHRSGSAAVPFARPHDENRKPGSGGMAIIGPNIRVGRG